MAAPETRAEDLFDWPHRRPVVVSDAGAGALADVPVRLLLDAGSFSFAKAAGDGADLRAVADDGATPLPLWIESWDVAFEEATVWVRLPAIPAGGSTGFVLLYGNPGAASVSTREARYEVHDDFDGTALDATRWSPLLPPYPGGSTIGVAGGHLEILNAETNGGDPVGLESVSAFRAGGAKLVVEALDVTRAGNSFVYSAPYFGMAKPAGLPKSGDPDWIGYSNAGDTWWGTYQYLVVGISRLAIVVEGGAPRVHADSIRLEYVPDEARLFLDGEEETVVTSAALDPGGVPYLPDDSGAGYRVKVLLSRPYSGDMSVRIGAVRVRRDVDPEPAVLVGAEAPNEPAHFAPWQEPLGAGVGLSDRGAVAMGDLDGDLDLDLVAAGGSNVVPAGVRLLTVLRNDGGTLVRAEDPLGAGIGLGHSSIDLGDVDGDGDLDIVGTGHSPPSSFRFVVLANDGTGHFTLAQEPMGASSGVNSGDARLGDLDQDGDLDAVLVGAGPGGLIARTFRNDGGAAPFVPATDLAPPGYLNAGCALADIDNDGDLDILAAGSAASWGGDDRFLVYRNDGGFVFTPWQEPLGAGLGVTYPTFAFEDLDADGDLDVFVSGFSNKGAATRRCAFLRNDGGTLVLAAEPMGAGNGVGAALNALGDVDGDGDADLVALGGDQNGNTYRFMYLRNDGDFSFALAEEPFGAGKGLYYGSVALGDIDLDGDLDTSATGHFWSGNAQRFFLLRNDEAARRANAPPAAPSGLSASTDASGRTTFSWGEPADDRTPSRALGFDLRVGTSPGAGDVRSGARGSPLTGGLLPGRGPDGLPRALLDLPDGTYRWAVRAVDAGLSASPWSAEATLVVGGPPPDTTPPSLTLPPANAADEAGPYVKLLASAATGRASFAAMASATDDQDPAPAVTSLPALPASLAVGTTLVVYEARDAAGNVASAALRVVVVAPATVEMRPPVLCRRAGGRHVLVEVVVPRTSGFDARAIDPASVTLRMVSPSLTDPIGPAAGVPSRVRHGRGRDRDPVRSLRFERGEVRAWLAELPPGARPVFLLEGRTADGRRVEGHVSTTRVGRDHEREEPDDDER